MRVLELGSYIIPAYAGMILAEQDHYIVKLTHGTDPIQTLHRGDELWHWINAGKYLQERRIDEQQLDEIIRTHDIDVVIENIRPQTWHKWGIDPNEVAHRFDLSWIGMRSDTPDELDGVSFDVVSQARSWMEFTDWQPFYVGDTTGGLWLAFKALSMHAHNEIGFRPLYQASLMQKLVEGELIIDEPFTSGRTRWDIEPYGADDNGAAIEYRGRRYEEPVRDRAWKLKHLKHCDGRIIV